MDIIKFIIEVTRRCTLNCEHCFRGEAENIDIEEDTIINSLKDVNSIKKLVITGGEPFLVHEKLEIIAAIINEYNIYVQDIYVVTNGTVLNDKVRNVLNKLSKVGNLHISVSFDSFHEIELERKNLKQIRDKNTKELIENYNAIEYGHTPNDIAGDYMLLIYPIGRAKNLTKERVKEIEDKLVNNADTYKDDTGEINTITYNDDKLTALENVNTRVKYTINFTLSKIDEEWMVDDLTETERMKIHGLYAY